MSFALSRHLYETSAAEHMLTLQPDWPVSDGEADGADIVIQLRHNGNKFGGHFSIIR